MGGEVRTLAPGIFEVESSGKVFLATLNLTPGRTVYREPLFQVGSEEYRSWNPTRSKLAAAIMNGLKKVPIAPGSRVLYLGVASGTTCSHVSDIVGEGGHVWGVDFSARPLRDLIDNVARYRRNISPILGDARSPQSYSAIVPKVDVVYADVAQPDQADIVVKNARLFLREEGWALLAVKSRSVDVTRPPAEVYEEQVGGLRANGFEVSEVVELEPFERDHAMAVALYG